jgi:AraC-like DNA-binding protein
MVDSTPLSLHAVLRGEVWLTPPAGAGKDGRQPEPVRLLQGDVALVHSSGAYGLSDDPASPRVPLADVPGRVDGYAVVQNLAGPAEAPTTLLLCGAYRFSGDVCDSLLEALPSVLRVSSGDAGGAASLRTALAVLADEIASDSPGQAAVLDRLLDLLLVFTLRAWFAGAPEVPRWYRALDDPGVARALRLLHGDYRRKWTVGSLADAVGLSRAAFARRFTALVGQTPMGYLTAWRMTVAAEMLRDSDRTLAAVAREVGYDNEFAFATAFRRERGVAPGRFRRGVAAPAG